MPATRILLFLDDAGVAPVDQWILSLPKKVQGKAYARIQRLAELGHDLRRPESDYIAQGIHELRWEWQGVNYRILYFFHERTAVVLTHGLTKEDVLPTSDLNIAVRRKQLFETNPIKHTAKWNHI